MTRNEASAAVYEFIALVTFGIACLGGAVALGFL